MPDRGRERQRAHRSVRRSTPGRYPTVRAELAERDAAVQRGEFRILGKMLHIVLVGGSKLDLRKAGSAIAQLNSGAIVLLEPWAGLPELPGEALGACPDCTAPCDECAGKGKRTCVYPQCGGAGKIRVAAGQLRTCPACKGKKKAPCALCAGTGTMSTGRKGGSPTERDATGAVIPRCATCGGNKRVFSWIQQPIAPFITGRLEGMAVVGPIASIAHSAIAKGDPTAGLVESIPDAQGNHMVLLIEGQRAHLYGGIPRLK